MTMVELLYILVSITIFVLEKCRLIAHNWVSVHWAHGHSEKISLIRNLLNTKCHCTPRSTYFELCSNDSTSMYLM